MPFTFPTKYDIIPWLNFPGEEPHKVIYETKLLGATITSDLTFGTGYNKKGDEEHVDSSLVS